MLIGIEIALPGQAPRFVGKVTEAPLIEGVTWLRGRRIFYREHPSSQLFSRKYDALSVDEAALTEAWALGAVALVCYATDERTLYVADQAICERSPRSELRPGEGLQVRVPRGWLVRVPAWPRLAVGYTARVVRVVPQIGPQQEALFSAEQTA